MLCFESYEHLQQQTFQNFIRCAKMIQYEDKYSSTTDARYTLHWLPIKDGILYKILCLAFKCIHGLGPSYINEMFVQNIPQRRLISNSTNEITYIVPRNKNKTFGDRSFSFCGPYEWNNLPNELKCIENYTTFKKCLKTYYSNQPTNASHLPEWFYCIYIYYV